MLYHFNDIDNRENDILSASFRHVELAPMSYYANGQNHNSHRKTRFDMTFSEKFESVKINNKSIREIVFPKKSTIVLIIFLFVFVSYLYLGAFCFKEIELGKELQDRKEFYGYRMQFLKNHSCVEDQVLEELISTVQTLSGRGVNPLGNASTEYNNWDFTNAIFFATSLVTTIGYGNDKPVTVAGKVFCIVFVMFGIPMMMIMTSAVVERLFLLVDLWFSALFYKLQWKITESRFRECQIVFSFLVLAIFFYLIPAFAFYYMEQPRWSHLDSLYFCVISLTTIGLGDLVPGDSSDLQKRNLTRVLVTIYLFTGLLATSFFIRAFHCHPKWNLGEKFIYLNNEPPETREYSISTSSTVSDLVHPRYSTEQMESFPVTMDISKYKRGKRIRYNSFS